ncbi:MAG: phosphotransferase, partial [Acidimicrobiales bacterium]
MPTRMHDHEVEVDEVLVGRLLAAQMPDIAGRPLTIVEPWGTDNAIWRLGDDLVVRLPRIESATGQVELEWTWLPRLAPHLSIAVPEPVALGQPGFGYPFRWAVHRWVPGEGAGPNRMADPLAFAIDLAETVSQIQSCDTTAAPAARNRARPLQEYDEATRRAIDGAEHL